MGDITSKYKRVKCDSCPEQLLTSVTRLGADGHALQIPSDWRLIWDGRELKFRCDVCWLETEARHSSDADIVGWSAKNVNDTTDPGGAG